MKSVGIICECNPPHAGHLYLLQKARESGADAVVCLLGSPFTQRGEPCALPARVRAEMLLSSGGADLVLEFPYPYAASGAEFFGSAGVNILDRLGVDEICFGSECGDLDRLRSMAKIAESADFQSAYAESVASGAGTAEAFFDLLTERTGGEVLSPNDILGLSYLRAVLRQGARISPRLFPRVGSGYADDTIHGSNIPSATALRRLWREEGSEAILPYLPEPVADILRRESASRFVPPDFSRAEQLILGFLRLCPSEEADRAAGLDGGLGRRLLLAAREAGSVEELFALASNAKYPLSRIRRGVVALLCGTTTDDLRTPPPFVRLLGSNRRGREFLSAIRRTSKIPVATKAGDLPRTASADRVRLLGRRAGIVYSFCKKETPAPARPDLPPLFFD